MSASLRVTKECPIDTTSDEKSGLCMKVHSTDQCLEVRYWSSAQPTGQPAKHAIAYFSKKLLPREQRYSTVEKKCLTVKLGMQAFSYYLLGRPFTIQTDHRALQWMDMFEETNSRLTRWSVFLQAYQF